MPYIHEVGEPVRLKLEKKAVGRIRSGYPWIYRDWLRDLPSDGAGRKAIVRDPDGEIIAVGFCEGGQLAVRILVRGQTRLDDALVESRLQLAWERRSTLRSNGVTGYRAVHGEGDGLAGLVCDVYDSVLVIKLDGEAAERFWNPEVIAEWFLSRGLCRSALQRFRGRPDFRVLVAGEKSDFEAIGFSEYEATFFANTLHGQKTGFFFDQRENRRLIGAHSESRRVLNLFAYTGGFSVHAGLGGATEVTSVDIAAPALQDAQKNWIANGLSASNHKTIAADVFEFLDAAVREKKEWDLIIVDPPAFARSAKHVEQASKAYERVFALAARCLSTQGVLALSSCSRHISAEAFLSICEKACRIAKRNMAVLANNGQPIDHPIPLQCSELRYLKFIVLGSQG